MKFKFFNLFKRDSIKMWGAVIFIIILVNFLNGKTTAPNIINEEKYKVSNVIDRVLYRVDFVSNENSINLIIEDIFYSAKIDLVLTLPVLKKEWVSLIKSALQRGVRVRIITKDIFKNTGEDLKNMGAIVVYRSEVHSGFFFADNIALVMLSPTDNEYIATTFMNKDIAEKYKVFIEGYF